MGDAKPAGGLPVPQRRIVMAKSKGSAGTLRVAKVSQRESDTRSWTVN